MERLTSRNEDCVSVNGHGLYHLTMTEVVQMADRLAAYEDTGWTPEMLRKLGENAGHLWDFAQAAENMTVGRLKELAEADKDGRVVVLPCKVGDTVWRIKRTFEEYPDKSKPYIEPDAFLLQDVFNIGKTVFLTREEAEKALQEMEDKKDGKDDS